MTWIPGRHTTVEADIMEENRLDIIDTAENARFALNDICDNANSLKARFEVNEEHEICYTEYETQQYFSDRIDDTLELLIKLKRLLKRTNFVITRSFD